MSKRALLYMLCLLFCSPSLLANETQQAKEAAANDYQYFQLEPDIITNYIKVGKRIGFIRVTVDIMVKSKHHHALIEAHEPLIRDRIIRILGQQTEDMIKSTQHREEIRQRCLDEVNAALLRETEEAPVIDLIFTKYLYQ